MNSHVLSSASLIVRRLATCFATGRQRLLGALVLAGVCTAGYASIGIFNVSRLGWVNVPAVQAFRVDRMIPFTPAWVWIYLLYYPFCFLPLFLREVRENPSVFSQTLVAFALQFGACFGFFLLWPLRMHHPVLSSGINANILRLLYGFDLGYNSFPSLHVTNCVFVSCLYLHLRGLRQALPVCGVAGLIAVSTLLVKQHFFSDILVGALLGWGSFVCAFTLVPATSRLGPESRSRRA